MGRGTTTSPYTLGERKIKAFEMLLQGHTVGEVAEELVVSQDTASRYKKKFEEDLKEQAAANPNLLRNYLENTVRSLEELDMVRRRAWDRYEETQSDSIRAQMLNIALKAQSERSKLFGLFGVKQEYYIHVQQVHLVQQRLLQFMQRELCSEDRQKLERYLTNDLQDFLAQTDSLPIIDVEALTA